jgi:hypothetical protein
MIKCLKEKNEQLTQFLFKRNGVTAMNDQILNLINGHSQNFDY